LTVDPDADTSSHMSPKVEGIITPLGASAGSDGKSWSLGFRLNPWRVKSGEIVLTDLCIQIPMDKDEASAAMSDWPGGDVVRLQLCEEPLQPREGYPWWFAHGSLPLDRIEPDSEIGAIIVERAKTRACDDPELGRLTLDRRFDSYATQRQANGLDYELSVETRDPEDDVEVARAIRDASRHVMSFERNLPAISDAIADEMLDDYNETWREEGPPISRTAFMKNVRLSSFVVCLEGAVAYFDDNDLFAGHAIEVRLSPDGEVEQISLAG